MGRKERRGGLKRKINRLETIYVPRGECAVGVGKQSSDASSDKFSACVLNGQGDDGWGQRHRAHLRGSWRGITHGAASIQHTMAKIRTATCPEWGTMEHRGPVLGSTYLPSAVPEKG